MDRGDRPIGREKHVSGSGEVHRRGEGLHSGPVGSQDGYSGRGQQHGAAHGAAGEGGDRGIGDLLGGASAGNHAEQMLEQMVLTEAVNMATKKGKKNPMLLIIGVVALLAVAGGGGLSGMIGGGSGEDSGSVLEEAGDSGNYGGSGSYGGSGTYGAAGSHGSLGGFGSYSSLTGSGSTGNSGSSGITDNQGRLNTSVAPEARPKRTKILGDGKDQITIMVYMCGTDLESKYGMATADMMEMAKAKLSDKVNLLVYTGGCEQWKNEVVDNRTNQIYQIKDGGLKRLEGNVGSKPMTDPDTLSEYIRWAKKNYPADRYELILWDHGGGSTSGYGYDQLYQRNGSMTLDKIGTALKDGDCTFDFVGFDACLMATLENALVIEPYSDYLIASEETEPGVGWYYTNWLTKLSENTSMETIEIGKNIVDDFVQACGQQTPNDSTTLAVIDLAEVKGTVPDRFKEFAQSATNLIQKKEYDVVSNARSQSKEFAKSSGIDQVDLIDLAVKMDTEESKALAETLQSCVKYNRTSSRVQNAYGISIYFPYKRLSTVNKMANTYEKIGLDDSYSKCITSFASLETAGQSMNGGSSGEMTSLFGSLLGSSGGTSLGGAIATQVLESLLEGRSLSNVGLDKNTAAFLDKDTLEANTEYLQENQLDGTALLWESEGGNSVLKLTEEQWKLVQNVELNLFIDDGSGYIDLGLDNSFDFDEAGNLIGSCDGSWLAINGEPVAYYFMSAEGTQDDYKITGRVPVKLNGQQGDMILVFTSENPDGEVAGVRMNYTNQETETLPKGLIEVQEGDTIDFLCDYYSYDQKFLDDYDLGDQMTVTGDLNISNVTLTNEDYVAAYRLTDIYNNHYWTPEILTP